MTASTSTRTTRRQLLKAGAMVALAGAFAGCSGSTKEKSGETTEAPKEVTKVVMVTATPPPAAPAKPIVFTFQRFFGECSEEYKGVTDLEKGRGECGIIQVLTNKWNAEHPEAQIETIVADWGEHNARLAASIAAGDPPDVSVVTQEQMGNYVYRGLLMPMDEEFQKVGIDTDDFVAEPRSWISKDGKIYGLPWDMVVCTLWYINADLWEQAGLLEADGQAKLPKGKDEFMAFAEQVKEKTGKYLWAFLSSADNTCTSWLLWSLIWQQGGDVLTTDLVATINTPEALNAVRFVQDLFRAGQLPANLEWDPGEQMWLQGEAATWVCGTWAVDSYDKQIAENAAAFKAMKVVPFPTVFSKPALRTGGHAWAMPVNVKASRDAAVVEAVSSFMKYMNDNNLQWARAGHFPARKSVIESSEFAALPHRSEYQNAAAISRAIPSVPGNLAVQDIMSEEISSIWLGQKTAEQALADAQKRVDDFLSMAKTT